MDISRGRSASLSLAITALTGATALTTTPACEKRNVSPTSQEITDGSPSTTLAHDGRAESRPLASATTTIDPKLAEALAESAVTDRSYARRVLYSWTSREQAETLRRGRVLLLPTELPTGPTPYVHALEQLASNTNATPYADVARLLLGHPNLKLRRYAWTRAWPTRLGLADRDYGDQLLQVVLHPRAIIGRFDASFPDLFEFVDLDQRPVPIGEVIANPSRLAAILHVHPPVHPGAPAFREYVLCNESMVSEWSLATPAIKNAIAEDRALQTMLLATPWSAASAHVEPPFLYTSSLAFDTDRYRASPETFRALDAALATAEQVGVPLIVSPTMKFDFNASVPNVRIRKPAIRIPTVA